ncbi:MAG: SUMF1/EgtB/PvdO family nonheme iron enzyme, partial [Planctomycetales bacterium]|nr:SUMF1/EgtB/PvdO family nonheme iron enzyme [Planctomycetales bacterium]
NVMEQLDVALKVADKSDLIVVALSGHGAKIGGKSYFCPLDARPDDPDGTMISIEELYARLERCPARLKIVLVDACRNKFLPTDSKPLAEQQKSIDGFARSLADGAVPKGVALLASCTSGEQSWEDSEFGHGVFMHFVLEGLKGLADRTEGNKDNWVSLFELCDYVQSETKRHVRRKRGVAQRPHYHTSLDLPDFRLTQVAGPPRDFTNTIGMQLMLIPAGEFMMGSPEDEKWRDNDEHQHRVMISQPFYLGATEVTQGQWEAVMGTTPWKDEDYVREGAGNPASYVSWEDSVEFCKRLSQREGRMYRLPTEAEWEYACRGETTTAYYFGDDAARLSEYAWFDGNSLDKGEKFAHRVGLKKPNGFGLNDMHGNVWEWCADWYADDYYKTSPVTDPDGPATASRRVIRGGGWDFDAGNCRAAFRGWNAPAHRDYVLGFRVALVPPSQ